MLFKKKKAKETNEMNGYNEEKIQNTDFMPKDTVKKINDEIDRVFREDPLKIQYPTFEEFSDAIKRRETFELE